MRVTITSSNVGNGTKVVTDDGAEIKGIRAMTIGIGVGAVNTATMEIVGCSLNVSGDADFLVIHPIDGDLRIVRRMEFWDGSEWVDAKESE